MRVRADRMLRGLLLLLLVASPASAQTDASTHPRVVPLVENVTRLDTWSFFRPSSTSADSDYTLLGNRATLGVRVNARRLTFEGSFRYAQLVGLPSRASSAGPLGPGSLYFAAARTPAAYQLYFKTMSLRVKNVVPGLSVEGGRIPYESGEATRFAGRLIGTAPWTIFERSFDGLRVDYQRHTWRAHASFMMPTQGAFEESANPTIGKVQLASASWTRGAVQLFAHDYRDTRSMRARPDNTGFPVPAVDIHVQTYGASASHSRGGLTLAAWGAIQSGRWFDDRHRAYSVIAEATYQSTATGHTAVTAGWMVAAGDDDARDDTHETFFPLVPTTAPHVLGGTFAQMNLRDVYGRVSLRPGAAVLVTGAIHHLSLATPLDRWYSGTGATALRGEYFGYSTRPSRLARGLGTTFHLSAEGAVHRTWTLKASVALINGGDVVRRQFSGGTATVFVLQSRFAL